MRPEHPAALLVTMATIASCVFPTERDSSVRVSLTPLHILFRGSDTIATARAWEMTGAQDSVLIPDVVFVWASSDPGVATVDTVGRIVGLKSGTVVITAAAANFDKQAHPASDTIRVAAPLEVDSVRPRTVQYGEMLTIYGVGVDSIFAATLSGAALIPVPYSDSLFAGGTARSKWWVPPPAKTDSVFFLGISGAGGVFGYVHGDTTTVVEKDLYEPDDTTPRLVDLDGPPPFTASPTLVFFNPALAFETLKRNQQTGSDWYRLTQAETRDVTIILSAPQIAGTYLTYLTDSLGWNRTKQEFVIGHDSWTFGPGFHACHGLTFTPSEAVAESSIVAFKALPAGTLDDIAVYRTAGRYGLGVIAAYQSELAADAHEDDNSCNAADLRGTESLPFHYNLTIENPHDVDWIRFNVVSTGSYRFRLSAFGGAPALDSLKDLDLYLIKVPTPGDTALQIVMADTVAGSNVDTTIVAFAAGNYYAVVVDFAGQSTQYQICAGTVTSTCPGHPAPPLSSSPVSRGNRRVAIPRFTRAPPIPATLRAPSRP